MDKREVIQRIIEIGLVPVIRASSSDEAMRVIDAILEGGISVLEITMTVPGAMKVMETLAERYGGDALIGAGTVLDSETARACILSGAQFVISPALDLETIQLCKRYSITVMPGALTPTEVVTAWQAGADFVKVFPCSAMGGASYIKGLKAPLPQIELVPTGGVNLKTAADFIKAGSSALGVGADLVDVKAIRAGEAHVVTERARQFLEIVREARSANA
ncbi:MAG: bifunctional 2-keto-4-hydroxyglutarate aldolase/2-keto-3-deoxy-6-phosphogluconate aldolase [Acidobacteriota bacterium]|nr:bifunctional 2-keto-4-hydroxyglutarate aldolase/2-keto-3-deoxy-6-phosphogluconate aldolase [Acidobacteriota bacterium]